MSREHMGTGGIKNIELSPLDTARPPIQTKNSVFEKNQMAGMKGKK